jgi:hypothetical protein
VGATASIGGTFASVRTEADRVASVPSHLLSWSEMAQEGAGIKSDTAGEVIFAPASTLTHQVFNGPPNMNRAYFRLRHQYQK